MFSRPWLSALPVPVSYFSWQHQAPFSTVGSNLVTALTRKQSRAQQTLSNWFVSSKLLDGGDFRENTRFRQSPFSSLLSRGLQGGRREEHSGQMSAHANWISALHKIYIWKHSSVQTFNHSIDKVVSWYISLRFSEVVLSEISSLLLVYIIFSTFLFWAMNFLRTIRVVIPTKVMYNNSLYNKKQ